MKYKSIIIKDANDDVNRHQIDVNFEILVREVRFHPEGDKEERCSLSF